MTEKYRIISLLGSGGFANVFLAENRESGEQVAIKILHRAEGHDRFAREAQALSALRSPHTVRLREYGRTENGPFMAFEYIEGAEELETFIERMGAIPWEAAIEVARQILLSLAEAHELGIVHRDIKPANILITPEGIIKVLDFGLVRLLPSLHDVTPLTVTGTVLGTPRYMAPEVLRASESAAPRADIFAVGMIAYQLIVGTAPNNGRSAYEVIARHLDSTPYELPHDADVPYAIRVWIDAMLKKDAQRRTVDATTALAQLRAHMAETPMARPELIEVVTRETEKLSDDADEVVADDQRRLRDFVLEEPLGHGATATVWSARHQRFGGGAAVKILLAGAGDDVRGAFFAEARAHAGLEHPHIVRLLDFGHVTDEDSPPDQARIGDPYLVMELASGTLRDEGLPTSWAETLRVLLQVLDGLAYAHARGVIHRDLKPENVLCFDGGIYKVADFGIAHSVRETTRDSAATLAETIGTPLYMSPEQFRGHAYDYGPATDLYAMGCMAYELIVGRVPFGGPRLVDIAMQHATQPMPTPIPRFEVPAGLAGWLARLLGKRPHERFGAAADASWQLRAIAAHFESGDQAEPSEFSGPSEATFVYGDFSETRLDPGDFLTILEDEWENEAEAKPSAQTQRAVIEPAPLGSPPIPASWKAPTPTGQSGILEGLGLFSLRELPLAGQDHARDVLWDALHRADTRHELVPVVLRGGLSAPVSQLGAWFAARAAEVGGAHTVFLSHTLTGAPREGLVGALEDLFGTWALDDDAAAELIRGKLVDDPDATDDVAGTDAQILTQELLRARGSQPGSTSSERERFASVARVLRDRASQRPLVIFVDHVQYSSESTAFVRYLLDEEADLPAVVVLGKRGEAPRASLERDLETLAGDPRCSAVDVSPYTDAEFAEFAELLLPMDAPLVELLADATGRDPALAQLAVADLIDRELLDQRGDVFATTRALEPMEMSSSSVIERRLERLDLDPGAHRALAVCAILSDAPDFAEVSAVCERMHMPLPDRLGASLEEVGLARSSGPGWWFTDGVPRVLLSRMTDVEQREIRRECGRAVLSRTAPDDADSWSRAARYFIDAGAADEALEPLYRAVRLLVTRDLEAAEALVAERGALLAVLGTTPQTTVWIDQLNLMSVVCKARGDRKAAMEHINAAHDLAQSEGYSRGLARALRDSATVAVDLGSLGEAAVRFDRAATISAESGDLLDEAHAWFGAGFVEYRRANLEAAETYYTAAIERFEAVGAHQARARAMSYLSAANVARGRYEQAREQATSAQDIARSCGALAIVAETKSDLAEIARFTGDYELARSLYEETAHWQRLAGSRGIGAITTLNLALVDLGAARYDEAAVTLDALEKDVRELGLVARLPLIRVARLVAMVGSGDDALADELLADSSDVLATTDPDRDVAWAYQCGMLAAGDDGERRSWFQQRAVDEYRRLGDQQRAADLSAP